MNEADAGPWPEGGSTVAQRSPEGGFRADDGFHQRVCVDSRYSFGGGGGPHIRLTERSPESGRAGDHWFHSGDACGHGGGLAAHQLHSERADDESAEESSGDGDWTATGRGRGAACHDRNSLNRTSVWKTCVRIATEWSKTGIRINGLYNIHEAEVARVESF